MYQTHTATTGKERVRFCALVVKKKIICELNTVRNLFRSVVLHKICDFDATQFLRKNKE